MSESGEDLFPMPDLEEKLHRQANGHRGQHSYCGACTAAEARDVIEQQARRIKDLQDVIDVTLRRLRVVEEVVQRETIAIEDTWNKYVPRNLYRATHSLRTLTNNIDANVRDARRLLEQEVTREDA